MRKWLPLLFVGLFMTALFFVLKTSLAESVNAVPPITPLMVDGKVHWVDTQYRALWSMRYLDSLWDTVRIGVVNTGITVVVGYLLAFCITQTRRPLLWLALILVPACVPFLLRTYAWMGVLGHVDSLVQSDIATHIVMFANYLPFALLPCYASLSKLDTRLVNAAKDMGASGFRIFCRVIVPNTRHGITTALGMVLLPSLGEYAIPSLVGHPATKMLASHIWEQYFSIGDWPMASALATMMVLATVLVVMKGKRT